MFAKRILMHVGLAIGLVTTAVAPGARADDKPRGEKMAITDKPLTIKVEPDDALRTGLTDAVKPKSKTTIRLTLTGVVPPAQRDQVEGVRVFLNKEDATRETSIEDPHYVTAFVFAPTTKRDAQEFNLDLTRAVGELGRRGELDPAKPLRVTLVAVPAQGVKQLPVDISVPVGGASVRAEPAK